MDRTTIIRGPCQVIYDGVLTYSQSDVKVTVGHNTFPIVNSAFGLVQERSQQRIANVSFTPVGNYDTRFWAFGTYKSGDRLLGNTDKDLVIWSYGGTKCTVYNVGITKIPDITLSTVKTIAGEITFTGLGKGMPTLVDQSTADAFFKVQTGQGVPPDTFDPATVLTQPYTAAWGDYTAPWNDIRTTSGWNISFDLGLQPVEVDSHGMIDWTVGEVKASARGQLVGINEQDIHDKLNIDVARGAPLLSTKDLVLSGTGLVVRLYAAEIRTAPLQYGLATLRLADVEFSSTRKISGSAIQPMFSVAAS